MDVPEPICPTCKGTHFLLDRQGERSVARVCACNRECPTCEGRGRVMVVKDGYSYAKTCACQSLAMRVARFNQARLPARCGLGFDEYDVRDQAQEKALNAARTTAMLYRPDAPSKGFIISGPVGTGKTHLLCATLRHLTLELGVSARYVEISFLFAEIKNGFSQHRSGLDVIQPLVDVDVLAVDELGKGRGSAFELDTLDELIARRYNAHRTTLLATNYSLAEEKPRGPKGYIDPVQQLAERGGESLLRERVGERIYSRLHEMCHFIEFPQTYPDYRRLDRGGRR